MRTEAQINASRLNGAKSRGPVTPEGKRKSIRYGTRNGLLAQSLALQTEDPNQFRDLLDGLCAEYQPATVFERILVESMAIAAWKQLRYRIALKVAVDLQADAEAPNLPAYDHPAASALGVTVRQMHEGGRCMSALDREDRLLSRQYERTEKVLADIRKRRRLDPDQSGPAASDETTPYDEAPAPDMEPTQPMQFVGLRSEISPLNPKPTENKQPPSGPTPETQAPEFSQPPSSGQGIQIHEPADPSPSTGPNAPFADPPEPTPSPTRPTKCNAGDLVAGVFSSAMH